MLEFTSPSLASIESDIVPIVAVGGGALIAVVYIMFTAAFKMSRSRDMERSRREIAAYVAEGTISSEEGERLMNAGEKMNDHC